MLLTAFRTNYYYSNGWSVGRCNPRIYLRANELTYRSGLSHQFCLNLFTLSLIYLCSLRLSVTSSKIFRIYKIFYDIAKDHHSIVFLFLFFGGCFCYCCCYWVFFKLFQTWNVGVTHSFLWATSFFTSAMSCLRSHEFSAWKLHSSCLPNPLSAFSCLTVASI